MADIVYVSKSHIERKEGPLRIAHSPGRISAGNLQRTWCHCRALQGRPSKTEGIACLNNRLSHRGDRRFNGRHPLRCAGGAPNRCEQREAYSRCNGRDGPGREGSRHTPNPRSNAACCSARSKVNGGKGARNVCAALYTAHCTGHPAHIVVRVDSAPPMLAPIANGIP